MAAFLETLDGEVQAEARWLTPPAQAIGNSRGGGT